MIPPINPTGTKTETSTNTIAMIGLGHFAHRPLGGVFRRDPILAHMAFDVFDHDNRIVHHDPDRQDHPEERDGIDGESQGIEPIKVPISDTGTATVGMIVARQL